MSLTISKDYPEIVVGIRQLKKCTIYPLSFTDIRALKGLIISLFQNTTELRKQDLDLQIIGNFIVSVLEENIVTITNMVLSEAVSEDELTLHQISEIAKQVYLMNFEGSIKNFLSLWKLIQKTEGLTPKAQ